MTSPGVLLFDLEREPKPCGRSFVFTTTELRNVEEAIAYVRSIRLPRWARRVALHVAVNTKQTSETDPTGTAGSWDRLCNVLVLVSQDIGTDAITAAVVNDDPPFPNVNPWFTARGVARYVWQGAICLDVDPQADLLFAVQAIPTGTGGQINTSIEVWP